MSSFYLDRTDPCHVYPIFPDIVAVKLRYGQVIVERVSLALHTNWIKCIYYYCRFKQSSYDSYSMLRGLLFRFHQMSLIFLLCQAQCPLLSQIIRITF